MATRQPMREAGKVNGLQRRRGFRGPRVRLPHGAPTSLIAAGAGLYAIALAFPLVLHQASAIVFAGAVLGTALLLVGLHVRWTRARPAGQ